MPIIELIIRPAHEVDHWFPFLETLTDADPSLWRRLITLEERKKLIQLGLGYSELNLATNVILLKATEVDDIFNGDDEKYKALTVTNDSVF